MSKEYNTLWHGDYISVVSPKEAPYECVLDSNCVLAIPLKDGLIGIRYEVVPSYEILDESQNIRFYSSEFHGILSTRDFFYQSIHLAGFIASIFYWRYESRSRRTTHRVRLSQSSI